MTPGVALFAGGIRVGAPLPNVACRVVQSETVGRKGADGSQSGKSVGGTVLVGKPALPGVGDKTAVGRFFSAPRIVGVVQPGTRRVFPFGLAGKAAAGPTCIGRRVAPGNLHHRMILATGDRSARSGRVSWRAFA